MATAPARPLVAVDANVVMDLGRESESVLDALATIRQRLRVFRKPSGLHIIADLKQEGWTEDQPFPRNEQRYQRMGLF